MDQKPPNPNGPAKRPMKTFHLITQDVLTRGYDVKGVATSLGWTHTHLEDVRRVSDVDLGEIEEKVRREGQVPIVLSGLPIARAITRNHPGLASGVFLDPKRLEWSYYTSHVPQDLLLNPRGILVPFGHIPTMIASIRGALGNHVFVRPNSSLKPFTGFDASIDRLPEEVRALGITEYVDPAELCVIAPRREVSEFEYRFWVLNGQVSEGAPTGAPYTWTGVTGEAEAPKAPDTPDEVMALAQEIAPHVEDVLGPVTCDIALTPNGARVVEFNAISTSGFYPGMNIQALLLDISKQFTG